MCFHNLFFFYSKSNVKTEMGEKLEYRMHFTAALSRFIICI